ncbi:MAG TPA: hypothetical protein VGU64_20215 [Terriglobales bacterium]|nr:hypothetical protein [Terriglobales bacterium]
MADFKNSRREKAGDFSDATIRRFLLAQLSPDRQSLFEKTLFTDERLEQRVRLAEFALTDDYVFERLTLADRRLFERKFLLSGGRRNQLAVSTNLRNRFAPMAITRQSVQNRLRHRLVPMFNLRQRGWRIVFSAVVLLLLLGTVWLVIRRERRTETPNRAAQQSPSPRSSPVEANHATNTATPQHEVTPSPPREHDQTVKTVSLSIPAHAGTKSLTSIALPRGDNAIVRFTLALIGVEPRGYKVTINSADGNAVFALITSASPGDGSLTFDVPASRLKRGEYRIDLESNRSGAKVAVYSFLAQ